MIDEYRRGIPTYKGENGQTVGMLCETKEQCITDDDGVSLPDKLEGLKKYTDDAYANSNLYTDTKIGELINGAPTTLDTLKEIADAMEDNADVVEALDKAVGSKVDQAEYDGHADNGTIHVTAAEKEAWSKNGGEEIQAIINGTTTVGNANKLGGKGASEYALGSDLAQVDGTKELSTSILEKALTLETGVHEFMLAGGNYSGNDLPRVAFAYGNATVFVKQKAYALGIVLWGSSVGGGNTIAANQYNGSTWQGWEIFATTADLANYLPLNGLAGNINPVSDLNNFFSGVGLFNGATNAPDSSWWLVISSGNSGTTTQVAFDLFNVQTPKTRKCAGGTWYGWEDLNVGLANYQNKDDAREISTLFNSITTPTDIRSIMCWMPSGHYTCSTTNHPNVVFPFENAIGVQIDWERLKLDANGYFYGTLTLKSMVDNSQCVTCSVYNSTQYTEWVDNNPLNYLPKYGGQGNNLYLTNVNGKGHAEIYKNNSETADYGTIFRDINSVGNMVDIELSANSNKAYFIGTDRASKEIHHDGNSAKCVVVDTDPGVGASVSYADGTLIFVKE